MAKASNNGIDELKIFSDLSTLFASTLELQPTLNKKTHTHTALLINLLSTVGRQVGAAIETARLYDETRRRAKALEALSKVSHTLVQDRYPEEIMQLIVNMTAQMMGSNICSIMLLDDKSQELRVVAAHALDPQYRDKPPVKVNGSLSGRTVLTKQPVIVKDVRQEASY